MVMVAPHVFAVDASAAGSSDGSTAQAIATYMYCGTKNIIQGYVGLLCGLALAALGLWALIQGKGMASGLTLIIAGSLVTALPSLIESTLSGFGNLLTTAGIATTGFSITTCGTGGIPTPPTDMNTSSDGLVVVKEYGQQLKKSEPYQPPPPYDAYGM